MLAPVAAFILGPLSCQTAILYSTKIFCKNKSDDFWAVEINNGCLNFHFSMHPPKNHTNQQANKQITRKSCLHQNQGTDKINFKLPIRRKIPKSRRLICKAYACGERQEKVLSQRGRKEGSKTEREGGRERRGREREGERKEKKKGRKREVWITWGW